MKAYEICAAGGIDALRLSERPTPRPGSGQVLVQIRANSINYRDLLNIQDPPARGIVRLRAAGNSGRFGEMTRNAGRVPDMIDIFALAVILTSPCGGFLCTRRRRRAGR